MWLRLFPSIFLCIFHLFIPKIALAQKFVTDNRFQKVVNNFAEDTELFTASVGIGIIDLQTGNIVASYNPNINIGQILFSKEKQILKVNSMADFK